jgi:hypothetical protein
MTAAMAGLVAGAAGWLLFSHGASAAARVAALQDRAQALAAPRAGFSSTGAGQVALARPIFALTAGPHPVADTIVVLSGIQRTPAHTAALLSINGKPADWLELGATRDDVTLVEVQAGKVVVDTPTDLKEVVLGAKPTSATPGGQPASAAPPTPGESDSPPPGFRAPPPPASAP